MKKPKRGKPVKKETWDDVSPKMAKELSIIDGIMDSIETKSPLAKSKQPPVKKQAKRFDEQYWSDRQSLDKKMPKDSGSVNFED